APRTRTCERPTPLPGRRTAIARGNRHGTTSGAHPRRHPAPAPGIGRRRGRRRAVARGRRTSVARAPRGNRASGAGEEVAGAGGRLLLSHARDVPALRAALPAARAKLQPRLIGAV